MKDYRIYGDDADDFFAQYSKLFNVNISKFRRNDYFPDEGDALIFNIFTFLIGRHKKYHYKQFTVKDLVEGIKKGSL